MRFCPQCNELLNLKTNNVTRTLSYVCRKCNTETAMVGSRVYHRRIVAEPGVHGSVRLKRFEADPTLPRVPVACIKCQAPQTILVNLHSTDQNTPMFSPSFYCFDTQCRQVFFQRDVDARSRAAQEAEEAAAAAAAEENHGSTAQELFELLLSAADDDEDDGEGDYRGVSNPGPEQVPSPHRAEPVHAHGQGREVDRETKKKRRRSRFQQGLATYV